MHQILGPALWSHSGVTTLVSLVCLFVYFFGCCYCFFSRGYLHAPHSHLKTRGTSFSVKSYSALCSIKWWFLKFLNNKSFCVAGAVSGNATMKEERKSASKNKLDKKTDYFCVKFHQHYRTPTREKKNVSLNCKAQRFLQAVNVCWSLPSGPISQAFSQASDTLLQAS